MHQKERMPETMFCHIEEDMGMGTHVRVLSRAKGYLEEGVGILGNAKIAETALRLPCKYMGSVEYVIVFFDGGRVHKTAARQRKYFGIFGHAMLLETVHWYLRNLRIAQVIF